MYQLLIVDDQTVLADDLADMLPWHTAGIDVVHKAYSGPEALELMVEHPIDVVVTDIRMPGMSGLELIEEIRKNWKHVKCILLTGYDDFEYTKQALKLKSSDYLLKPAEDEELMEAVRKALQERKREWQEISSMQKAMYALREQLPKLREYLLLDLLSGKEPANSAALAGRLAMYELPLRPGAECRMLLLRLEPLPSGYNAGDEALLEYALTNMAAELFGDRMRLWSCRDANGFLVCVLTPKPGTGAAAGSAAAAALENEPSGSAFAELDGWVETQAVQLQHAAKTYLRTGISVLASKSGQFPGDIASMYQSSLAGFRHFIGSDSELFMSLAREPERGEPRLLGELYRAPSLGTLLELGQWEAAEQKASAIFRELQEEWYGSQEHILETYLAIASSIAALIHRTKKWLADTMGEDFYAVASRQPIQSAEELQQWTQRVMDHFRRSVSGVEKDSRSAILRKVQDFIHEHLDSAALQTISEHVHLNPSYLSKIYKLETGEGISEYILRIRMEKAAVLLEKSPDKIYEISERLGYQKPSYFIQLFRRHFGLTPQEYRNKLGV
ncbi:response regulator [Paenibacillus pinistramenti]|uniref:response regulator n=1 Tax=Paenibacillus pinistramenti TaxID=1768003 RepID=UPI0011084E87|nr:response regulator [Paenibacillus pinistramenti]